MGAHLLKTLLHAAIIPGEVFISVISCKAILGWIKSALVNKLGHHTLSIGITTVFYCLSVGKDLFCICCLFSLFITLIYGSKVFLLLIERNSELRLHDIRISWVSKRDPTWPFCQLSAICLILPTSSLHRRQPRCSIWRLNLVCSQARPMLPYPLTWRYIWGEINRVIEVQVFSTYFKLSFLQKRWLVNIRNRQFFQVFPLDCSVSIDFNMHQDHH